MSYISNRDIESTGYWLGLETDDPCGDCSDGKESDTCLECRNEWKWSNGDQYTYQNWENKEPNDAHHECGRWFFNGKWRDESCGSNFKYICKFEGTLMVFKNEQCMNYESR